MFFLLSAISAVSINIHIEIFFLLLNSYDLVSCFLREYFEDVDRTWETFETTLWDHISNFFNLAKER